MIARKLDFNFLLGNFVAVFLNMKIIIINIELSKDIHRKYNRKRINNKPKASPPNSR